MTYNSGKVEANITGSISPRGTMNTLIFTANTTTTVPAGETWDIGFLSIYSTTTAGTYFRVNGAVVIRSATAQETKATPTEILVQAGESIEYGGVTTNDQGVMTYYVK